MDEELYIRIENGNPVDHPIAGWNLRMFYPNLKEDNIPTGYERFTRLPIPELGEYQILEGVTYEKSNYGWHDKYIIRDMNDEERKLYNERKQEIKEIESEIKLHSELTLKTLGELLQSGKVEPTAAAILKYLRNNK